MIEINERYLLYLIEKIKSSTDDLDYVDIVTEIMEEHNLTADDIIKNLPKIMIEKLKTDFKNRHVVKEDKLKNVLF